MFKRVKVALPILVVGAASWWAPAANADQWDKMTILTFNEPVEVPGQVLAPGTYVFKLADSQSDRTIVQIFTEDKQHLVATVMAIRDYRLQPSEKTIITFEERPSGSPQALHSWFYPGLNDGIEFVYSKSETQFAKAVQPASAVPAVASAPEPDPQGAIEETPAEEQDQSTKVALREEAPVLIAQLTSTDLTVDDAQTALPDTLPQTAGNFLAVPLLGIVLLCAGFAAIRFAGQS